MNIIGQTIQFYPEQFGSTYQTISLVNPVYHQLESFQGVKTGVKNNTGVFNEIKTIYIQGALDLKKNNSLHSIGADFISEQEGPVIRKNRIRFNYAIEKEITHDLTLGLGTHLGLSSFDYNGSKATSQGASIGPDGSIGLLAQYKSWYIGGHINQIFDQVYQPKSITFTFPTYFGYYIEKSWKTSIHSEFRVFHMNQLLSHTPNYVSLGCNYEYQKILGIGLTYHHNRFLTPTFYFDVMKISRSSDKLKLYFSYNYPIQDLTESRINAVELGLIFNSPTR